MGNVEKIVEVCQPEARKTFIHGLCHEARPKDQSLRILGKEGRRLCEGEQLMLVPANTAQGSPSDNERKPRTDTYRHRQPPLILFFILNRHVADGKTASLV